MKLTMPERYTLFWKNVVRGDLPFIRDQDFPWAGIQFQDR